MKNVIESTGRKEMVLDAEKDVPWGVITAILDAAKGNGVRNILNNRRRESASPLPILLIHHQLEPAAANGDTEDRLLDVVGTLVTIAGLLAGQVFFQALGEEGPKKRGVKSSPTAPATP